MSPEMTAALQRLTDHLDDGMPVSRALDMFDLDMVYVRAL